MINDNISDMLTRIRNAILIRSKFIKIPKTLLISEIIDILFKEQKIFSYKLIEENKSIPYFLLILTNENNDFQIRKLTCMSKPGCRVYKNVKNLPNVLNGFGIAILSTPRGIITNKEAKKKKVGGEVICSIW